MAVIDEIRKRYSGMSTVERRIADVILVDPLGVTNMTIAHLADRAGVSQGSVVNFSDRVGIHGFSQLKLSLAREMDMCSSLSFGSVNACDTPKTALQKVTGNAVDAFQKTCQSLEEKDLQAAAESMLSARRIEIYGAGDSALIAQDAYFHLMRIGLPAYAVTDYLTFSIASSQLDEGCAALAISHSGKTMAVVDAMGAAKARGARTICITSFADSALGRLCDVVLPTRSCEAEQHQEAAVSRLAHLLVLDSLCAYISARQGVENVERLDRVERLLARHRYET